MLHGGTTAATTGTALDAATGFSALGDVLAEVRELTGVVSTDEVVLSVGTADVLVVVVVVVVVAGVELAVAASAASRFFASLAIRSLSGPLAPASLKPPIPPIRLPTLGAVTVVVVVGSATVTSAAGSVLTGAVVDVR